MKVNGYWLFIVRSVFFCAALGILLLLSPISLVAGEVDRLKISTWAGAYQKAQDRALFKPFAAKSGLKVKVSSHNGVLGKLKSWYLAESAPQDVVNMSSFAAEIACDSGYLVSLNSDNIAKGANNEPIEKDFLANSLLDCAVPNAAWSGLLAVKTASFKKAKPRGWRDFFNVKKFPGKRSLRKTARFNLEMALLADGVELEDVYETLSEEEGLRQAFKKLNSLKDFIVWWESGAQSIDMLRRDDVVMGFAFNGRLFNAIVADGMELTLIWQGQIYDVDYWAIPKHSKARREALDFVQFATAPEQMAAPSKWFAYGPMRQSSLQFIGMHKIVNLHMGPYLPTTKAHFRYALKFNEGWWKSSLGKRAEKWFEQWESGKLDLTAPEPQTIE